MLRGAWELGQLQLVPACASMWGPLYGNACHTGVAGLCTPCSCFVVDPVQAGPGTQMLKYRDRMLALGTKGLLCEKQCPWSALAHGWLIQGQ